MRKTTGCLVCGAPLVYLASSEAVRCALCGQAARTEARCQQGHYVCDRCHALPPAPLIEAVANASSHEDPLQLAAELMNLPEVAMHGPEHHFMVAASLLATALRGDPERRRSLLAKASERAAVVPGGFCGLQGTCGAAIGVGIFFSVLTGATPLSRGEWRQANSATAHALEVIASHGGPRCCKRNTFLAIRTAAARARRDLGLDLRADGPVRCEHWARNAECLHDECPFYEE